MEDFNQLSPAEVATLWLASDLNQDISDKATVLASNATLTLMVVLAEGFARLRSDKLAKRAMAEIATYSRDLVDHIADRGSYVRYDQPVRKLIGKLDDIGFPILPSDADLEVDGKTRSRVAVSYELAAKHYKNAVESLEKHQLLIDPPWYKTPLAIGSLIILLGSVPLEINIKTHEGQNIVTSVDAKFWSYENSTDGETENTHINIRIAKFIDKAIENLSTGFVEAWKEQNPTRVEGLESEVERLSEERPIKSEQ